MHPTLKGLYGIFGIIILGLGLYQGWGMAGMFEYPPISGIIGGSIPVLAGGAAALMLRTALVPEE